MASIFNQNRRVIAKLKQGNINTYGKTFAIDYQCDGFNIVNVGVQPLPTNIKEYLEGDETITSYAVPINVDKLCDYALASFPNIEELTLFSLSVVDINDHLSYLTNLKIMYVNEDNLSGYSWFPTTIHSGYDSFTSVDDYIGYVVVYDGNPYIVNSNNKNDLEIVAGTTIAYDKYLTSIIEDYTYVIEDTTLDHVLTSDIVTEQLNQLSQTQKNAITKVVIDSSYTSASADNIAWAYNFSALLPSLNNNIWYGTTKVDFSEWLIEGEGNKLTSEVLSTALSKISTDKYSLISKIKISSTLTTYDSNVLDPLEQIMTFDTLTFKMNCQSRVPLTSLNSTSGNVKYVYSEVNPTTVWQDLIMVRSPEKVYFTALTQTGDRLTGGGNIKEVYFNEVTTIKSVPFASFSNTTKEVKAYFPKATQITTTSLVQQGDTYLKVFIGTSNCTIGTLNNYKTWIRAFYFKAEYLTNYLTSTNWVNNAVPMIGFLDYTDTIPTFSGYTDSWYEDEDCTTPIATTDFVSGNRYYVKLQAI